MSDTPAHESPEAFEAIWRCSRPIDRHESQAAPVEFLAELFGPLPCRFAHEPVRGFATRLIGDLLADAFVIAQQTFIAQLLKIARCRKLSERS